MNEATIAAISERASVVIPSDPDEITEALVQARDDVRWLLAHSAPYRGETAFEGLQRHVHELELDVLPEIERVFEEIAKLRARVRELETR